MKKFFIPAIFSVAMLASVISYGQQKNMINQAARTRVVKEPAREMPRKAFQREVVVPLKVTDPPIVNDHLDIYSENPTLLKATITIHFGDINAPSPNSPHIGLDGSPYYFYHKADHIGINTVVYSSIRSNSAYTIQLYTNSDNHWTVTLNDFVDKWVDGAHTHLNYNQRVNQDAGMVSLYQNGMSGSINKLILVLQFSSGTKTIVWNNPKTLSNNQVQFKFDQNFNPMN